MSVVTTLNLVKSCFPTARVHVASTQSYVNRCTLHSLIVLLKVWLTRSGRGPQALIVSIHSYLIG